MALQCSSAVREIETHNGAVLLDINRGICLSLTPVAILIWRKLKEKCDSNQVAEYLARTFSDVSPDEIQGHVSASIADLQRQGLLLMDEPIPKVLFCDRVLIAWHRLAKKRKAGSTLPRFLTLKAFLGLFAFDLFRLGRSFSRLYRIVQLWTFAPNPAPLVTSEVICNAVNYACVWYPKRVLCLQRSAVTTWLLRNCGISARMVIGAQTIPFKAHAWTEVDGNAVNERRDVQQLYLVWDKC